MVRLDILFMVAVRAQKRDSSVLEEPISDDESNHMPATSKGGRGKAKIDIRYIEDKNKRHITFSKRKAGIMKKVS
jgi:pheromone receptor transcription factor